MINPLPNQVPTQPCPSWPVIQQSLETDGWPAYLCALRIVFDWCQSLTVQLSDLQQQTCARPLLPGSIPATGVSHMPSAATNLSGQES